MQFLQLPGITRQSCRPMEIEDKSPVESWKHIIAHNSAVSSNRPMFFVSSANTLMFFDGVFLS